MNSSWEIVKHCSKKLAYIFQSVLLSYPRHVQCNICWWEGRRFSSDSWHSHIYCPSCNTSIRHRLFFATLHHIENLSFEKLIHNKKILHFAPESIISSIIRKTSTHYVTADYFLQGHDLKLDMSNMPKIIDESFDLVIAFDVLEHVPDYQMALDEVHRVLISGGFGIFTVPQKDNLLETYEDPRIIAPEDRKKHFGHYSHLRIFGDDFSGTVESKGFSVTFVDHSMFPRDIQLKQVLFPPTLSNHPLATNYRKVFFCQKTS